MQIIIGALARREILDGAEWYENQQRGLGLRFKNEIRHTINRINLYPDINTEISNGIRRCLVKSFPYMVIYATKADTLEVIAIAHQHRRPGYWKTDA